MIIMEYETAAYDFRRVFEEAFATTELEQLHEVYAVTTEDYAAKVQLAIDCFGDRLAELCSLSKQFVVQHLTKSFGAVMNFQAEPTIRIHFSVSDDSLMEEISDAVLLPPTDFLHKHYFQRYRPAMFHRDKDYGLDTGAVNIWVPITPVCMTSALWVGGYEGGGVDARPVPMLLGQYLVFDGASRWHGAVWNTSGRTRISFDVRVKFEAGIG